MPRVLYLFGDFYTLPQKLANKKCIPSTPLFFRPVKIFLDYATQLSIVESPQIRRVGIIMIVWETSFLLFWSPIEPVLKIFTLVEVSALAAKS